MLGRDCAIREGSGDYDFRGRGGTWWSFILRTYEQIQYARQQLGVCGNPRFGVVSHYLGRSP